MILPIYYAISNNYMSINFLPNSIIGLTELVPNILAIYTDDYRYEILRKNFENQNGNNFIDTDWFNIDALDKVPFFMKNPVGDYFFEDTETCVKKKVHQAFLRNLINYYDSPIYDTYVSILKNIETDLLSNSNEEQLFVYISSDNIQTFDGVLADFLKEINIKPCYIPYVAKDILQSLLGGYQKRGIEVISNLEDINNFLISFWKKPLKELYTINNNIKNNSRILEKFVNQFYDKFYLDSDTMKFILNNPTDYEKIDAMYLTGMLKPKNN